MGSAIDQRLAKLLDRVGSAYEQSHIKQIGAKHGGPWFYSLTATKVRPEAPLLVGFNWGVDPHGGHEPQQELPSHTFEELIKKKGWLGSFARIAGYLQRYRPFALSDYVQTSFCFFRSQRDNQIDGDDLSVCQSLFRELVAVVRAKELLFFSSRARDALRGAGEVSNQEWSAGGGQNGQRRYYALKADYQTQNASCPAYFLPHPNYPISGEVRENAWTFCFGPAAG